MRVYLTCNLCGGTRILKVRSFPEVQRRLKGIVWCGLGDHPVEPSAWQHFEITNLEVKEDDNPDEILRARRKFSSG